MLQITEKENKNFKKIKTEHKHEKFYHTKLILMTLINRHIE